MSDIDQEIKISNAPGGTHKASLLVVDLVKRLMPLGYSIDVPLIKGYFRYGLYAPQEQAWASIHSWDNYLNWTNGFVAIDKSCYLGDFQIDLDPRGNVGVIWYLESPLEEGCSGLPNPMHCDALFKLAAALYTDVRTLLKGGEDAQ